MRAPQLTREQKIERQGIKERRFGIAAICGPDGRVPDRLAWFAAMDAAAVARFRPGDLVIARDQPSRPLEVVSVLGGRVFLSDGSPSRAPTELHQTGRRAVGGGRPDRESP